VGWTDLFGSVVAQGAGLKQPEILKAYRASRIDHTRGVDVSIRMDQPQKVQVDGEALGKATAISARVDAGALVVRVPATNPPVP
jgi:diacylglycerol kinase family enzyme